MRRIWKIRRIFFAIRRTILENVFIFAKTTTMNKIREYCNSKLKLEDEYREIFGKELPRGKMFCPFHDNKETPAAKRYDNSIVCFSCNKTYRVYDLLCKYNYGKVRSIMENVVIDDSELQSEQPKKNVYEVVGIDRDSTIGVELKKLDDIWQRKRNLG